MDIQQSSFIYRTLAYYFLAHAYVFWSLWRVLASGSRLRAVLWLLLPFFLAMGLFPLCFRLMSGWPVQRAFAMLGMYWQPAVFFSLLAFVVWDCFRVAAWGLRRLFRSLAGLRVGRGLAAALLLLAALLYGYGLYEARVLRVTHIELRTSKLPPGHKGLRLAFVADIHLGPQLYRDLASSMVAKIAEYKPDCILLGGDILDDADQGTDENVQLLRGLKAPLGVYAVLGNHDAFGDAQKSADFLKRSRVTLLSPGRVTTGPLLIAGVDDPRVSRQKGKPTYNPMPLLPKPGAKNYTIMLAHQPVLKKAGIGRFDLQLSGHTHGGQLFFLRPLIESSFGTRTGLSTHSSQAGESTLYVTRGVGYSKLPIRLLTPPELVIIDLLPEPRP
ncbi:metallophosphoesterase [Desulfovibrio sp. OttesenSCG-928-A18]|nr:metallophosphoesterase [Desulfovibrio sp. OttesenSCG-928-A18]